MSSHKEYWNSEYLKMDFRKPKYDLWLDKYDDLLKNSREKKIIDLGCGRGNNSLYLIERGYKVISCDISDAAVNNVKACMPEAETMIFDMLDGNPFENDSCDIIIADLCLHYFSWTDTERILEDIRRILKNGGHLLARVNSVRDINYGAGQGTKIEDNYYDVEGKCKRFFDGKDTERLFLEWELKHMEEYQLDRYKLPKIVWEIAAVKV